MQLPLGGYSGNIRNALISHHNSGQFALGVEVPLPSTRLTDYMFGLGKTARTGVRNNLCLEGQVFIFLPVLSALPSLVVRGGECMS